MVGRKTRYLVDVIRCTSQEDLFIYDYSSFTSTLHEIRNFTAALARFFEDTFVTLVDTCHGPIQVSLGEMLNDFNDHCNLFPRFDTWKFEGDLDTGTPVYSRHNCGMLGVPGNISSCTLLHGLHLCVLVMYMEACRCVGDDALGVKLMTDLREFIGRLQNIGRVSFEKTIIWEARQGWEEDESRWHYTKRPIGRAENRVYLGAQAIFPPLASMFCVTDGLHTTTFPERIRPRGIRIANFLVSFAIQFSSLPAYSEVDKEFADDFVRSCTLGLRRYLQNHRGNHSASFIPSILSRIPRGVGWDSFEEHVHSYIGTIIRVPVADCNLFNFSVSEFLPILHPIILHSTRSWKLGVDMEWVESKEATVELLLTGENVDILFQLCLGQLKKTYSYTVLEICPSWFRQFLLQDSLSLLDPPI